MVANAELDHQDDAGWTAVHYAAFGGHCAVLERLLSEGAEIDVKDQYSWTSLQRSASNGRLDVLRVLADSGANLEVRDREGMTSLSTAAWKGHATTLAELLIRKVKIEVRDYEDWTALHHACWNGRTDAALKLLERGTKVDAINKEDCTPLFQATWNGHIDIVDLLLEYGANVNKACSGGETPLQQAAWAGHLQVVDLLLRSGSFVSRADPNVQNSDGQTAYDQAEENSYATTALVLLEKGSPHPSVSSSSILEEELIVLDSAIAEVLAVEASSCIVQRHGHACSSTSWKVSVAKDGEQKTFFLKTGPEMKIFAGESASLQSLNTVEADLCPRSIAHGKLGASEHAFLLTEFIHVGRHSTPIKPQRSLAQKLANLHSRPMPAVEGNASPMFGFVVDTFAGPVRQINSWKDSWVGFSAENRLRGVCRVIASKYDDEATLFTKVDRIVDEIVPQLLATGHLGGSNGIKPSLVHGDLWSGNKTCVIIDEATGMQHYLFDTSSCYAHSEYELGLMRMFGGFSAGFFSEYHRLVPKTEPRDEYEDRMLLYQLYHWLVNYAITGGGFKGEAIACMNSLLAKYGDTIAGA